MTKSSLTDRANAMWGEFCESGDPALLDEAAGLLQSALRDASDSRERASLMSNLATVLQAASDVTGDAETLRGSIDLLQQALVITGSAYPIRAALVVNLAAGLQGLYRQTGDTNALLRCIELLRREVDEHHATATHATLQNLLSAALLHLYLAGGASTELNDAVVAARIAVNLTPLEDPQLPSRLTTLASALSARSEATQDLEDLYSAIDAGRHALELAAPSHRQAIDLAANLGALLHSRFELTGSLPDLDEAIALTSSAAASAKPPRAMALRNLAAALLSRFELRGAVSDLDDAIALYERVVAAPPGASGPASEDLADLGRCRSLRYRVLGQAPDILEAIAAIDEAVRRTPAEHPRLADYLSALAEARFLGYSRQVDDIEAATALAAWQRAAVVVGAGTSVRLKAAQSWAAAAAALGNWTSAADGYETAVGLLPELLWRSADQADRLSVHDDLADLPSDAAACMIEIGKPTRALELLELARGVLWRWLLGVPTGLDPLRRLAPELAGGLVRIRNEVDHTGVPLVHVHGGAEDLVDRRVALAREWDELVEQVRSLPGFEDFLRPPRTERLFAAAGDGPVVVVNASRLRCDALVLSSGGISIVPLPELTHDEVVSRLNEYLNVVAKLGGSVSTSDLLQRERVLTDLLAWMWRTIAVPVLDHLGFVAGDRNQSGRLPRIWLCPTGPLAVLPLHAAGSVGPDGSLRGLIDQTVPSYTASVSQLAEARLDATKAAGRAADKRPLLVSLSAAPGLPGLPAAFREIDIFGRFTGRLQPTILRDGDATTTSVRRLLADRSWVHFSCHGAADIEKPWRSGIQLYDGRLPLTDIAAQEGLAREMVFLSSCETSAAGMRIADESVNLVAALQRMGARHVVGALWPVRDESAAVVTDHLYRDLDDFPSNAAHGAALRVREAVMELRRVNPHAPSVWACFAHYGP